MPNSVWTETGSGINLVPSTTPVSVSSSPEDANYLTNSDKIALMAQYAAELATKTSLGGTAASLGVSTSAYDSAVAAINTTLTQAGAPSNWATAWPDGSTFGPVVGIQTLLSDDWAQVASTRAALQSSIAEANASSAQAAAIAQAATDATNKMNAAVSTAAPIVVSGLPALPNTTYPSGKVVWNASDNMLYQSTGSAWAVLVVAGANIQAGTVTATQIAANTITAGQIAAATIGANQLAAESIMAGNLVIANFDNLIPNPNSEQPAPAGGWPSGAFEAVGLTTTTPHNGSHCRAVSGQASVTPNIPVSPGDWFYASCYAYTTGTQAMFFINFFDSNNNYVGGSYPTTTSTSYVPLSISVQIPANTAYIYVGIRGDGGLPSYFDDLYLRRMADANLLVDGSITAQKISAGAITGDMITAGKLTADVIYFSDGFCLNTLEPKEAGADTTADHVLTEKATCTNVSLPFPSTNVPLTGLSFSVAAQSLSDVYNVSGILTFEQAQAGGSIKITVHVYVDGSTARDYGMGAIYCNGGAYYVCGSGPFFGVITGLSAGSHTIQVYADYTVLNGSGSTTPMSISGFAFCQRVF